MLFNNIKIALRQIKSKKSFSLINIMGLAFSMAVCLMIALFLHKEYSVDCYHANAGRIFRLIDSREHTSRIDYRVKQILLDHFAEIENVCLAQIEPNSTEISYNGNGFYINNIMSADNAFFAMFTIQFLAGNTFNPLPNRHSAIVTESAARQIFGSENALGKEILVMHQTPVTVSAVIKDFPDNSSINATIIVNAANDAFKFSFWCANGDDVSTHRYPFAIYLQLRKGIDPQQLKVKINSQADILTPYAGKIDLLALKEMYLHDPTPGFYTKMGNPALLHLLTVIALIVFTLAAINYINLTLARQSKRNKETGIRKVIGAGNKEMIQLFLTESVIIVLLAFAIALFLTHIGLHWFNTLTGTAGDWRPLLTFPVLASLFLTVILAGLLVGIMPAIILASFNPIRAVSGNLTHYGRRSRLRAVLCIFQFTVSIILIFCLIVIQQQISFVKHRDPGFAKEQLLHLDFQFIQNADANKLLLLKSKLRQSSAILSMSLSNGIPGQINVSMGAGIPGKNAPIDIIFADEAFLDTFKIKLLKGRTPLAGDMGKACMINKAAYNYFGWEDLNNKKFNNGGGYAVIGLVKDFNFDSPHKIIEPLCIMFNFKPQHLNVRIAQGKVAEALATVKKAWIECVPTYPVKYQFYDEWFDAMCRNEERFSSVIAVFTLLAISISSLGMLGLAAYSAEARIKEIGIRKVVGASGGEIMTLLNRDFIQCVVIAFLIACPIAWLTMQRWLQNFAYRTPIGWRVFAASGITALLIALFTVSAQTWRSARANPVDSLKCE